MKIRDRLGVFTFVLFLLTLIVLHGTIFLVRNRSLFETKEGRGTEKASIDDEEKKKQQTLSWKPLQDFDICLIWNHYHGKKDSSTLNKSDDEFPKRVRSSEGKIDVAKTFKELERLMSNDHVRRMNHLCGCLDLRGKWTTPAMIQQRNIESTSDANDSNDSIGGSWFYEGKSVSYWQEMISQNSSMLEDDVFTNMKSGDWYWKTTAAPNTASCDFITDRDDFEFRKNPITTSQSPKTSLTASSKLKPKNRMQLILCDTLHELGITQLFFVGDSTTFSMTNTIWRLLFDDERQPQQFRPQSRVYTCPLWNTANQVIQRDKGRNASSSSCNDKSTRKFGKRKSKKRKLSVDLISRQISYQFKYTFVRNDFLDRGPSIQRPRKPCPNFKSKYRNVDWLGVFHNQVYKTPALPIGWPYYDNNGDENDDLSGSERRHDIISNQTSAPQPSPPKVEQEGRTLFVVNAGVHMHCMEEYTRTLDEYFDEILPLYLHPNSTTTTSKDEDHGEQQGLQDWVWFRSGVPGHKNCFVEPSYFVQNMTGMKESTTHHNDENKGEERKKQMIQMKIPFTNYTQYESTITTDFAWNLVESFNEYTKERVNVVQNTILDSLQLKESSPISSKKCTHGTSISADGNSATVGNRSSFLYNQDNWYSSHDDCYDYVNDHENRAQKEPEVAPKPVVPPISSIRYFDVFNMTILRRDGHNHDKDCLHYIDPSGTAVDWWLYHFVSNLHDLAQATKLVRNILVNDY